jgi:Tol biopolymer transport system component
VFIADIPDDVTRPAPRQRLEGTRMTRPAPPAGTVQRRLTYTADRKFPGVQGPRHWLQSAPDGSMIYFLMKDDAGHVQIYGVSPNGGEIRQITGNKFSVETTFSVRPDGKYIAYGSGERIYVTHLESGQTIPLTDPPGSGITGLKSICWSNNGGMIAYNRVVEIGGSNYYHIFILK